MREIEGEREREDEGDAEGREGGRKEGRKEVDFRFKTFGVIGGEKKGRKGETRARERQGRGGEVARKKGSRC